MSPASNRCLRKSRRRLGVKPATFVAFRVAFEELRGQIFDQLADLLLQPFVFALVVVNRIFAIGEQLPRAALSVNLAGNARARNGLPLYAHFPPNHEAA